MNSKNIFDIEIGYNSDLNEKPMDENEPRIELIGEDVKGDGMVGIELDWNEAFVNLLKSKGYIGSDEQIVGKWFTLVSKDVCMGLMKEDDPRKKHDYE